MGNPHVGFDEAGAGNGLSGTAPVLDPTDEAGAGNGLSGTAPALDPTCGSLGVRFPWATRLNGVDIA